MPPRPNVAVVERGSSDEITITLLGLCPAGVPARHEFKGLGLKQIDSIMLDNGIHVVAWIVPEMPWRGDQGDLVLIEAGPK